MRRSGPIFVVLIPVIVAVTVFSSGMVERVRENLLRQRNKVIELRELPVGTVVHFTGVATYIDRTGKQIWVQDETGAVNVAVSLSGRGDRKSTRLNSSHIPLSRMPSSA